MGGDLATDVASFVDRFRARACERGVADAAVEAAVLELRTQTDRLVESGLEPREAFLVALDRAAASNDDLRPIVRDVAGGLWEPSDQPNARGGSAPESRASRRGFLVMLAAALAAAAAIKLPELFGIDMQQDSSFYLLNLGFFALPFLGVYLALARGTSRRITAVVAGVFVAAAIAVNVYPFVDFGATETLTAIHLPIVLWLALGLLYASESWRDVASRMEFVRFTGEWFVTYVLIALGGGVLTALTVGTFEAIGVSAGSFVENWLIPCGATAAVVVAAWLVSSRRNLVGGMAPMLARVFTPLFAVMLVALLVGVVWTRGAFDIERQVLIMFDLLLVVVVALVLYAMSSRDPRRPAGWADRLQLVLVASALGVDLFALASIAVRLGTYGFSANKTAALGLNVVLLVNLGWTAFLLWRFIASRGDFADLERWQMRYLPVYLVWAAIVAFAFPLVFGFA